jgi:hypothetical protein
MREMAGCLGISLHRQPSLQATTVVARSNNRLHVQIRCALDPSQAQDDAIIKGETNTAIGQCKKTPRSSHNECERGSVWDTRSGLEKQLYAELELSAVES